MIFSLEFHQWDKLLAFTSVRLKIVSLKSQGEYCNLTGMNQAFCRGSQKIWNFTAQIFDLVCSVVLLVNKASLWERKSMSPWSKSVCVSCKDYLLSTRLIECSYRASTGLLSQDQVKRAAIFSSMVTIIQTQPRVRLNHWASLASRTWDNGDMGIQDTDQ